jgi:hypothetical protein
VLESKDIYVAAAFDYFSYCFAYFTDCKGSYFILDFLLRKSLGCDADLLSELSNSISFIKLSFLFTLRDTFSCVYSHQAFGSIAITS